MPGPFLAQRQRSRRGVTATLEVLENREVLAPAGYSMPLVDNSHLNPEKYSIYVGGFAANNLTIQPDSIQGVLDFATATGGPVSTYKLGRGADEFHEIEFPESQFVDGGRIYFFVVPRGQTPPPGTQPPDPPANPYLNSYIEVTKPDRDRPTVDLSTVDGFTFPMTLTLNDKHGEVGQPLDSPRMTRQAIITEFGKFMKNAAGGADYSVLQLPDGAKADGQSEGLLNPFFYLKEPAAGSSLPKNVTSPLNTAFDGALNTLFSTSGWSVAATFNGTNTVYSATAGTYPYGTATNPYNGSPVMLPGLAFQGGGNTFHVFNPVGVNSFLGANGQPIMANSVPGHLDQFTLTNAPQDGVLQKGMYVFGQYFDQNAGAATNYIIDIQTMGGQTIYTLKNSLPFAVSNDQVVFSKLPFLSVMQLTSGEMVFGNTGFFADANLQGITGRLVATMGNVENQIASALNRGVAVVPGSSGPLSPSSTGYATEYWGTETNWYPIGQPENLFSWFLHTAVIDTDPIYSRPRNAARDHNGALMGSAYGFAFDENPGPIPPVPPNQPQVPSKFDPVPKGTDTITVTLDPWYSAEANRGGRRT